MSNALAIVSQNIGVDLEETKDIIKGMIISAKNQHGASASDAELAIVASTCAKYTLNPLVKECAAFISGGKLQIVLMIDGWYKIVNRQADFDGVEFDDIHNEKGELVAIACRMFIKGRSRPVSVTEYMAECCDKKSTVWQKWPARMLRHKAYIQCARMTFGISEMIDEDEAERYKRSEREINPVPSSQASNVNWSAIDDSMGKCNTEEQLKEVSSGIRQDMEKRGIWDKEKHLVIEMNTRHKERIANIKPDEEQGAVIEGELVNEEVSFD